MSALPVAYATEVAPGIFRADPETVSESERDAEIAKQLANITIADLTDELIDCQDELQRALDKGDARVIGQMVLNVRKALAMRCADSWLYGSGAVEGLSASQAAAMAVYGGVL